MFNKRKESALGDIPGPPLPPETGFGMSWPGNNHMMQMQPMMVPMMHQMLPGQMQGVNYGAPNHHSPHFNQMMMQQQMIPPPLHGNGCPPPPPPPVNSNTDAPPLPSHPFVMPKINPAPPVPDLETNTEEANTMSIDMDVTNDPAAATQPQPEMKDKERQSTRTRSPPSSSRRDQGRDRRQRDSKDNGRRESGGRRDDRHRSRSRDRPRRERDRRSKWDSGDKDLSSRNLIGEGIPDPSNIEMMGQAQLEMMKSQQMVVAPGSQMGVGSGQGLIPPMNSGMPQMNPGMVPMNPGMMMMDPSMMGQMYPQMLQSIMLSVGVLEPPYPGTQHPQRRSRPPGCRTIFVGGLQDSVHEDIISEIFERFGKITTMRLKKGFCHVRFNQEASVEPSFCLTGYRLILNDSPNDVISSGLLIDYALNRDDQHDERSSKRCSARESTPVRFEHISQISSVAEKIKSDEKFAEALPTLVAWLESGECSKKNANTFYSMIQATNNHTRRLMNDKLGFDEEIQEMKDKMKDKAMKMITQFEQVVKVLTAANHRRVWDHFTKMQRKNVETWFKMSEELNTVKEEFQQFFNEDDLDASAKKGKYEDMYNEVKTENENLMFELEACKNEVHVAKSEAAREFEKFKAHFIAEQALLNAKTGNKMPTVRVAPLQPPPPPPPIFGDDGTKLTGASVGAGEGRLISVISMFLLVHPLGASLDYILSYVRTLYPNTSEAAIQSVLQKHGDVFTRSTSGVGAQMEHKWSYIPLKLDKIT